MTAAWYGVVEGGAVGADWMGGTLATLRPLVIPVHSKCTRQVAWPRHDGGNRASSPH